MLNRLFFVAAVAATSALAACRTNPATRAQLAALNDPRMTCARAELSRKGYDVDNSIRRPGELLATRMFTTGNLYRAAITAAIDSSDNALEVWTRVIRQDQSAVVTAALIPSSNMLADAMEVERLCASSAN